MKTKEISREVFNLMVRLLGLVMVYETVRTFALFGLSLSGVCGGLIFLAAACWLLRGAYPVAAWAYPDSGDTDKAAQEVGSAS